ncbi:MAG: hypothetical protein V8T82_11975 [Romboutsia timonensis]
MLFPLVNVIAPEVLLIKLASNGIVLPWLRAVVLVTLYISAWSATTFGPAGP